MTTSFEETVMKEVIDPSSQIACFDMRRDKAYEDTRSCNIINTPSETLRIAFDKLSSEFRKKHVVHKAYSDSITKGIPIQADEKSLDKLETGMINCHITLVRWDDVSELNSSQTLYVFKRLFVHSQRKFCDRVTLNKSGETQQ